MIYNEYVTLMNPSEPRGGGGGRGDGVDDLL